MMDAVKLLSKIISNEVDIQIMKDLFSYAEVTDEETINQAEKNMRLHLDTQIDREILGGKKVIHEIHSSDQ